MNTVQGYVFSLLSNEQNICIKAEFDLPVFRGVCCHVEHLSAYTL